MSQGGASDVLPGGIPSEFLEQVFLTDEFVTTGK